GIPPLSDPGRRPTGTTHASAVDAEGGSASLSTSNGSGSGVVVPGTGILLNNMLGEEDLNPDGFGALEPGRRMSSMMSPTLVLGGDGRALAVGSAGSNRLRSAITQTVARIVAGGLDPRSAVAQSRIHVEGGRVDAEPGISEVVLRELEAQGWVVRRWGEQNLFFGGVAVAGPAGSGLDAAGDPRRGGGAAGVTRDGEVVPLSR
ncbi:MAG: gamma-glutamyltransferase, partial [Miltoncostaeaceae bacterium]